MRHAALIVLLLASCASSSLESVGRELHATTDPVRRTQLVNRLLDSGDPEMVPLLIHALQAVVDKAKAPKPDFGTLSVTPESKGPELWGLMVATGQDFRHDVNAWRGWWNANRESLEWNGAKRRFTVR